MFIEKKLGFGILEAAMVATSAKPSKSVAGKKARDRLVHPVEFKPDQSEAIKLAAAVEGHSFAAWVHAAALEKAHRLGFWNPFATPGPKKDEPPS